MKLIRILTVLLLIVSVALWGMVTLNRIRTEDKTPPEILGADGPLIVSAEDGAPALMAGVTAYDDRDGDLTASIFTDVVLNKGGTGTVTYYVADRSNLVASLSRELVYTDYHAPRFKLTKELRYNVGSVVRVLERITAEDLIDGDVTDHIKITVGNVSTYTPGIYPVTLYVSNSCGDISTLTLDVIVDNFAAMVPRIYLSDYIVYPESAESFNPRDYLVDVENCSIDDVRIAMPAGGFAEGVNHVLYSVTNELGEACEVTLYVIFD